jgi:hypothetical protein
MMTPSRIQPETSEIAGAAQQHGFGRRLGDLSYRYAVLWVLIIEVAVFAVIAPGFARRGRRITPKGFPPHS